MRLLYLLSILTATSVALEIPFVRALSLPISIDDYIPPTYQSNRPVDYHLERDLRRRDSSDSCPANFHSCANIDAPGVCCADAAVCRNDGNGQVACCPSGAVCTGIVRGTITAGTVNTVGSIIGGTTRGSSPARTTAITSNSAGVIISSNSRSAGTQVASSSGFVLNGGNSGSGAMIRAEVVSTSKGPHIRLAAGRC